MNKQGNKLNPRGGIEWTHIFGPLTGRTANPVRGCRHGCRWRMPDGKVVTCYAKTQKERMSGAGSFEAITWHPEVLDEIRREQSSCGIFIDSMSDLFGEGVEAGWIEEVLKTAQDCPQHVFFSLTKNARRLLEFTQYPDNMIVIASSAPTFMFGREMSPAQQETWFRKALWWLGECAAKHKGVSLEPLSFGVGHLLRAHRNEFGERAIKWAFIGAGSDGVKKHQPDETHLHDALAALDGIPVFFKGNLDKSLASRIAGGWRAEFPTIHPIQHQP